MYKILKRGLDLIIACIAFPFLIIITIPIAIFIKMEDRGSIFYSGYRIGMNGKKFKMYKFRTMKENAPDIRTEDNSTYNSKNDSRVTKFGKIARETSMDELPQIINIIKGDMSFVGPRPCIYVESFHAIPKMEQERLKVRPGITGLTQAYYRNSLSRNEKFEKDIYYANHYNLIVDIKIICRTIISVLKKDNIYVE